MRCSRREAERERGETESWEKLRRCGNSQHAKSAARVTEVEWRRVWLSRSVCDDNEEDDDKHYGDPVAG